MTLLLALVAGALPANPPGLDRAKADLKGCIRNLRTIASNLETYRVAHRRYPADLKSLPEAVPICPAGKKDTYSAGYELSAKADAYTVYCIGDYHAKGLYIEPNLPGYNCDRGLILKPVPGHD